jgi:uncharacterized protein (DUF952 family)
VQLFHIATVADWEAAQRSGFYTTSTVGRTLQEEGFLHTSRADQWEGVRERYYADLDEPLVLLLIDSDRLTSPWREDPVGDDTYPHIYGPLNPDAVVTAVPLQASAVPNQALASEPAAAPERPAPAGSFTQVFFGEMFYRMGLTLLVLIPAFGVAEAAALINERLALAGAIVGLIVGGTLAWLIGRRRKSRQQH